MKATVLTLAFALLVFGAFGASAQQREVVEITALPVGEMPGMVEVEGVTGIAAYDTCDVGNLNPPVYAITDWLYGNEGYKVYVDPWSCPCPAPERVKPLWVTMYVYAYDTIPTCGAFQMQADVQLAGGTPSCPVPVDNTVCTSAVYNVTIPGAGLWFIELPVEDCPLMDGPFFISWWFLNDGGCLPGPLTVVTDNVPINCDSYIDYRGYWEDLVVDYGFPGVILMWATVECSEESVATEQGTWGAIKSMYRH